MQEAAKKSRHSPGPWRLEVQHGHPRTVMAGKAKLVCEYTCAFGKVDAANFRLLAAAPELLEALDAIVHWHDKDERIDESWWQAARDALAKAVAP